jgi:hypothetical protein
MNNVNHLLRTRFFTWAYSAKDVVLKSDVVSIRRIEAYPSQHRIQTDKQAQNPGNWSRNILEEFANSSGAPAEIVSFTERYEALEARIQPGVMKPTRFRIADWQRLQQEFRDTWEKLRQKRGRLNLPIGQLGVLTGESFHWWFSELSYETANLYRLLLLELYSLPRHRLRKCVGKNCKTPFFIADHLSRRYCVACKRCARLETKRKSWQTHKEAWR